MPTAIHIIFDRPASGFDARLEATALAEHGPWLNEVLDEARLEPLDGFFSVSLEELREALGGSLVEGIDTSEEEEWFPTADGRSWIADVRKALAEVAEDPRVATVSADLDALDKILDQAGRRRLRWHLVQEGQAGG